MKNAPWQTHKDIQKYVVNNAIIIGHLT
jgi:hypothetical protein